ncbi:YicC/YloC family endoribonuclease [Escherichia coli]
MRWINKQPTERFSSAGAGRRSLEPVVRERIRSRLTRGKVECTLRYEPDVSAQGELILNEKLAKQLVTAANWVKMQSDEGEINPVDILRWPGVMAAQEQDLDAIAAEILAALDGTLDDFIVARETQRSGTET